jgi:hypothetical protein
VVFADDFVQAIADRIAEVGIGGEDRASQIELDDGV